MPAGWSGRTPGETSICGRFSGQGWGSGPGGGEPQPQFWEPCCKRGGSWAHTTHSPLHVQRPGCSWRSGSARMNRRVPRSRGGRRGIILKRDRWPWIPAPRPVHSPQTPVLLSSGCRNKIPKTRWPSKRNFVSHSLEVKVKGSPTLFLVRALILARWPSSLLLAPHGAEGKLSAVSSSKETNPTTQAHPHDLRPFSKYHPSEG